MKKKILSIISLVLVCLMLVACGSSDTASTDTATTETATTAAPAETTDTADTADTASDDAYPSRPVTVIIPASAGGDTDINTRIFLSYMEEELDQTFVVSNINGHTAALPEIVNAVPDGYTLGAYHPSMVVASQLGASDYSYAEDFEIINIFAVDTQSAWFVSADSGIETLDDLAEVAKTTPVTFATEVGSISHLTGFNFMTLVPGAEIQVVDAGSSTEKITALLGGQLDMMYNQVGLSADYLESGDFHCLGIMADERSEINPDIPTFKEQGYDMNYDKPYWLMGPLGMDEEVVETLNTALMNVCANEEYAAELLDLMQTVPGSYTPEEAIVVIDGIDAQYGELIAAYLESVA